MRVVLIYRRPSAGGFSIERVFNTLAQHMRNVEVVKYSVSRRPSLLADITRIRKLDGDIYHVTGDVNYMVPFLPSGKTVLTVHDLGHYLYGLKGWRRQVYKWLWFNVPLHFASVVTCVSQATARDLVAHLPGATNVRVVENCVTADFAPSTRGFNSARPRILQVGTKPYKNVPRLVQALRDIPCTLVLVGPIDEVIATALAKDRVEVESHVGVDDAELSSLYESCDLVAFVSTGEGFGLPILEAQAAGKPLITSDVSPLNEIAGAGACLVCPVDVPSIRAGVKEVIGNANYRQELVENGFANLRRFQPEKIAATYCEVYRSVRARAY